MSATISNSKILAREDVLERLVNQGFHIASAENNMEILLNFCHIARFEHHKKTAFKNGYSKGTMPKFFGMSKQQKFERLKLIYGRK